MTVTGSDIHEATTSTDRGLAPAAAGWPATGLPVLSWLHGVSDAERLRFAAATLRRYGIAVATGVAGPADEAADRVVAQVQDRFPDADGACVVWTEADASRCVDAGGLLRSPLPVLTRGRGVTDAAAAAFGAVGLSVAAGDRPGALLVAGAPEPSA